MRTKKHKILLIEDDQADQFLFQEILGQLNDFNYRIKTVGSLADAKNALIGFDYDIILTDLGLSDSKGLATLHSVINISGGAPVIVLTGTVDSELGYKAIEGGAQDYLVKGELTEHGLERSIRYAISRSEFEKELHERESRLNTLFEFGPDGYFIASKNGTILQVNEKMEKQTGIEKAEMLYQNFFHLELFSEDSLLAMRKSLAYLGIGLPVEAEEYVMINRKGKQLFLEISFLQIRDNGQDLIYGILHDISHAKQNEIAQLKLYEAIEQSPSMIVISDCDKRIEYINSSFEEHFGYSKDEVMSMKMGELPSCRNNSQVVEDMWISAEKGESWMGILNHQNKEGKQILTKHKLFPIKDSEDTITNYVCIIDDISEEKNVTEELAIVKERALMSDHLTKAFLSNLSHEIRTPMNAIMGFTELLLKSDRAKEKQDQYLNIISEKSKDLLGVIDDLVDVAKMEAGIVQTLISSRSIGNILSELYDDLHAKLTKKLKFELEVPEHLKEREIQTDPTHLIRILNKLVTNAFKYTDQGYVRISVDNQEGCWLFKVEDTGIGIEPENFDRIFKRFRQEEIKDPHARGGTGLGLTVAADLVQLLEGKIWVESVKNQGSIFYVEVPDQEKNIEEDSIEHSVNGEIDWTEKSVLVAEDDTSNILLLRHLLSSTGINITHVRNGKLAVEAIEGSKNFDLVLMDMKMPVMNGYDATSLIKKTYPDLPIIAVTANADRDSYQASKDSGCDNFVIKPYTYEELVEAMSIYLNKEKLIPHNVA